MIGTCYENRDVCKALSLSSMHRLGTKINKITEYLLCTIESNRLKIRKKILRKG